MKRVANVFVLAVFLPSLVLAFLAIRSVRDQQFVLERQRSLLYQNIADSLVRDAQAQLAEQQQLFGETVERLLRQHESQHLSVIFNETIRTNWDLAHLGFVVGPRGNLLAPSPQAGAEAAYFCAVNAGFLANRETAEVYWNVKNFNSDFAVQENQILVNAKNNFFNKGQQQTRAVMPQQAQALTKTVHANDYANISKLAPAETEFRTLIGDATEGMLARFVENKLSVLVWYRPPNDPRLIFGAELSLSKMEALLHQIFNNVEASLRSEICLAVLNDRAQPVTRTHPEFQADWKRPFAAAEIGEVLPHWEVAVYHLNPEKLAQSAKRLRLFLGILIGLLVMEIALASVHIITDLKRQALLARQKTDFVSNVSHELKTPLTSIRMFSEMLAEGRVQDAQKQRSYLNIITAETARLTRLINNVLDFSRLERGEKKYDMTRCDLAAVTNETVEAYRPHLEAGGFTLHVEGVGGELPIAGDRDALAQVLVNLLSNAEKYSNGARLIDVQIGREDKLALVTVCDRGPGVPRGCEEKIFEQFFRGHDSLNSGIQGSGLGLTLARQIARAHGGDVTYRRRAEGGSCFTLQIPLA